MSSHCTALVFFLIIHSPPSISDTDIMPGSLRRAVDTRETSPTSGSSSNGFHNVPSKSPNRPSQRDSIDYPFPPNHHVGPLLGSLTRAGVGAESKLGRRLKEASAPLNAMDPENQTEMTCSRATEVVKPGLPLPVHAGQRGGSFVSS